MRIFTIRIVALLVLISASATIAKGKTSDESSNKFRIHGYLQEMPSIQFIKGLEGYSFNNTLHNRLNMQYQFSGNLHIAMEVRNRLLSGDMIKTFSPVIVDMLEKDNGLIDASLVPLSGDNWVWHLMSDRFYIDWTKNKLQIRLGRQRINWGINMVSNPNDLFNTYSFFDIDYPERPGADALRIQYFTGDLSRLDFAVNPHRELNQSTAAMLYVFNKNAYDYQIMAGYYRERIALGGGWAGNIGKSGFKGEFTFFNDINRMYTLKDIDLVSSVSFDYIFPNTLYVLLEALYNGGHKKSNDQNIIMMTEPMRADNIFFSKYALTSSVMYPVSPILSTSLAGSYMPDMNAFYLSPNLTYSVVTNLDISILAQYFHISQHKNTVESLAFYMQLKYSF
jgi:hypothetical protein